MRHAISVVLMMHIVAAGPVLAGVYPDKPVTLVTPYSVGGGTDLISRGFARALGIELGQPVVVVNKPGAGGALGAAYTAQAEPDGYTLVMVALSIVTQNIFQDAPVSRHDFRPVAQINQDPAALSVAWDSPWKTVHELIEYARANPRRIRMASGSPSSAWWLGGQLFRRATELELLGIPYGGGGAPVARALLTGEVELATNGAGEIAHLMSRNQVRILAVMSEERLFRLPQVPTLRESGIDLVFGTWRGVMVPRRTPDEIVGTLDQATGRAVQNPEFRQLMRDTGFEILYRNAADFAAFIEREEKEFQLLEESWQNQVPGRTASRP